MTRVSKAQMKKLLDLLSEDGVMVQGKVMYTDTNRKNFWKKVARQLNVIEGGAFKNAYKWCKMWADWKNKTKTKADILLKKKKNEFMPQPLALTNLELKLLQIISYPMGDILQLHFEMRGQTSMQKVELPDNTKNKIPIRLLAEDSNTVQLNNMKAGSDEEDKNVLKYFATCKRDLADSEEIIDEGSELLDDLSDTGKQMKKEDKEVMTSTTSFDDFKGRITLALEKERTQQKNEELRLKAIELKLKEEELRLKELEMNKVNYLTNLEEEKLKCLREISASLKELLQRTRNGSLRLSNLM